MLEANAQQTHRAGALKQANKAHKHGRHRSKGSISVATKGKVDVRAASRKRKIELGKQERRHQAVQIRQRKRDEVLSKKRMLGGLDSAPFLVCVLPLHQQFDAKKTVDLLTECDPEIVCNKSTAGVTHLSFPRFKQKFSLVVPPSDNELAVLDTLKVCDTVLFLISAVAGIEFGAELIDEWGNKILASAFAQGLPTPLVAITNLESIAPKKRNDHKQNIQKLISKWFAEEKVMALDKNVDAVNVLRKIGSQKRKHVVYRDRRPHLYAEHYVYEKNSDGGCLKVTGYLRGAPLSVNSLVHVPGLGDFQMGQIDAPVDPFAPKKDSKNSMEADDDGRTVRVLERADPAKQESLDAENVVDPMDAEQTWPTAEEMRVAEEEQKKMKIVKKIPKGWSDYQAAWIPDEDAETFCKDSSESEDDDDDEEERMDAMSEEKSDDSEAEAQFDAATESEVDVNDEQYDRQIDFQTEHSDLEKIKAAKSDLMFPDEVDTPQDVPARERFQKYRGLESFRKSPWNPKENLPSDYARIFQFENFNRTKKRVLKAQEEAEGALPGWYITIHVKNVPETLWSNFLETGAPVVLIGMYPHEHKMSVLNVVLKRTPNYDVPIASKERLIIQCGYRRFIVNPIFSLHTIATKYKYERFFHPDSVVVATFFAPIQFPPAPVLCYKEVNNKLVLVASGSLLSCNPDRLIIKRVVLSGHPFRVHKRSAVIRFMFFNREDILYFKKCYLRTKLKRRGEILEPLGTHGHMKCRFDDQLKSHDTVLLYLYKRVFPKWTYEDCIVSCANNKMES